MKITKYGHCCVLIEENGVRVLTDPGMFTSEQDGVKGIDVIVITHEHRDHFHIDSVKRILDNNPAASVITNSAVDKLLREAGIQDAIIVEDGDTEDVRGFKIRGYGHQHAEIYKEYGKVMNTGYFIGERLYYPGDAFHNPMVPVEVLALPVTGPWCKSKDAIELAFEIGPKIAFPVHDGILNDNGLNVIHNGAIAVALKERGIEFTPLPIGKEIEI